LGVALNHIDVELSTGELNRRLLQGVLFTRNSKFTACFDPYNYD
jgi:hypothetical protein